MRKPIPFQFEAEACFFEKSDAPAGQRRRIAGIISTESKDLQDEVVVQKGLDLDPFLHNGWFNDNHSKKTDEVLGYPTEVKQFAKGQALPNGERAKTNLTWAEGYLLEDYEPAEKIWKLGRALQKSGHRRLGFSIEGQVQQRTGPGRKTIAKALVRNVAITNCPVNPDTQLHTLAKSLRTMAELDPQDETEKALGVGPARPAGESPASLGPQSGERAGQILSRQALESMRAKEEEEDEEEKPLTKSEAKSLLESRFPHFTVAEIDALAEKFVRLNQLITD